LLALAACGTEKKPITGFDKQPPGTFLLDPSSSDASLETRALFTIFDETQTFRVRLNGQELVRLTSPPEEGFYDYVMVSWGWNLDTLIRGIPPGTYVVELADSTSVWGQSAPLPIPASDGSLVGELPTVLFTQAGTWTVDPATQDADPATDEITVTNLTKEDAIVQRCLIASGSRTACRDVGTVAPGADLTTVETLASVADSSPAGDHQALFIYLESDATESYQRDLVQLSRDVGACEVERILVAGTPSTTSFPGGAPRFAVSSCYGPGSTDL